MTADGIPRQVVDLEDLEAALQAPAFLLFKHSRICPVSTRAFQEYEAFLQEQPAIPTTWIDVIAQRPWSLWVAEQTGVEHQSPQALWIRDGRVAWHASHGRITADTLREAATST